MSIPSIQPLHSTVGVPVKRTGAVERNLQTNTDRLGREVIELLKEAVEQAKRAKGRNIIALIGNTGTGKSTAVNHLLGLKMKVDRSGRGCVIKVAEEEEIAPIGHRTGTSETRYAHVYEKEGSPLTFADCGGFFDTRGVSTDIAVVTSLKLTLENASSVRLVLCFDSNIITTDRAIHFSQAVHLVLGTLLKNYRACSDAVMIMFTKPTRDLEGGLFDAVKARAILKEIMEDLIDGAQKELYKFLLRDEGKYICVCDPLSEASRDANNKTLSEMGRIENTTTAFQTAYVANSQLKLLEEMTAIAIFGNDLYSNYFSNLELIQRYTDEIEFFNGKIMNVNESIQVLGNGESDPEAIKAAEERIITENQALIDQQNNQIRVLNEKSAEITVELEAIREKIGLLERRGEEEVEYWVDRVNQEGINIESKTVTVTTDKKSGFFGGGSCHQNTSTTSTYDKRSIPREFNYRGPEFTRVVKEPQSGSCWSDEKITPTSYFIHYESGKGEPAIAAIKVFIKRKHLPQEVQERLAHEQEIVRKTIELNHLVKEIGDKSKVIHNSELSVAAEGNHLEKLEEFKKTLAELTNAREDRIEKLATYCTLNTSFEQTVSEKTEDFEFLKTYLDLSKDEALRNNEMIAKFLTQDQTFRSQI